jgi:hypothetical protein
LEAIHNAFFFFYSATTTSLCSLNGPIGCHFSLGFKLTIKNQLQKLTRNSASMFEKILASLPRNGVSLYLSIRLLLSAENYFSKKKAQIYDIFSN